MQLFLQEEKYGEVDTSFYFIVDIVGGSWMELVYIDKDLCL